jgi:tetratricopeptide (TPR) repeat protein
MTFNVAAQYHRAVAANVTFWRERVLGVGSSADQWHSQHKAIWQAVDAGLSCHSVQADTVDFTVELMPLLERWGVWPEWLTLLETAETVELTPLLKVRLLLAKCRLYVLNRNFGDAVHDLGVALSLAENNSLMDLAALAHFGLVNAYLGDKNHALALSHGLKALELLSPAQITRRAALYNSLGLIELEMQAFTASEERFLQALALWYEVDEPTQLARTYLNLGVLYQQQQRWEEVKSCYERARTALTPTASLVDQLKVLNGLGALHYMTRSLSEAEAAFREGVTTADRLQGMYHLRGSLTHNLGNTLLALGRWVESRLYLEKSVRLWQQANDGLEQANSLGTLGELFEAQGAWDLATSHYKEALQLLKNYPTHPWAQKLREAFKSAQARCAAAAQSATTSG